MQCFQYCFWSKNYFLKRKYALFNIYTLYFPFNECIFNDEFLRPAPNKQKFSRASLSLQTISRCSSFDLNNIPSVPRSVSNAVEQLLARIKLDFKRWKLPSSFSNLSLQPSMRANEPWACWEVASFAREVNPKKVFFSGLWKKSSPYSLFWSCVFRACVFNKIWIFLVKRVISRFVDYRLCQTCPKRNYTKQVCRSLCAAETLD